MGGYPAAGEEAKKKTELPAGILLRIVTGPVAVYDLINSKNQMSGDTFSTIRVRSALFVMPLRIARWRSMSMPTSCTTGSDQSKTLAHEPESPFAKRRTTRRSADAPFLIVVVNSPQQT